MNKLLDKALSRSFSADDGGGPMGGGEMDVHGLADAAYDHLDLPLEEYGDFDFDYDEAYDNSLDDDADPLALSEEFIDANPDVAQAYDDQVSALRSNVEAMAPMLALEHELSDPHRAPEALRAFVQAIANHHGFDPSAIFGYSAQEQAPDWRGLGFQSEEEYYGAPEWQRQGFDSPNELRLAQELDQLRAAMAPTLRAQQEAQESARQQHVWRQFESAVMAEAPRAIAALNAEHGWRVTPEQALEAAARFPELAAQDLRSAILSAFPTELARHYAAGGYRGAARMPEMPLGRRWTRGSDSEPGHGFDLGFGGVRLF